MSTTGAVLDQLEASLAAYLPGRVVTRTLADPARAPDADLRAGLLCLVSTGGGGFANTLGRTGQLGRCAAKLVAFVRVDEQAGGTAVEDAELAVLDDVLGWTNGHAPVTVLPGDWTQSGQLEAPYGWLVLELDVRLGG